MLPSRPLVVGYPRTGFSLLINVLSELIGTRDDVRTMTLRLLCDTAGAQIARRIEEVFRRRGLEQSLIYNPNFRHLVGGPKWLAEEDCGTARFRKYIGVRGDGDFTLITSHPREVLDYYEVIHSHVSPATWPVRFDTPDGLRFASIRHPVGTLISACFSLNALASEYIQRFVPPEQDNDFLRQRLALYKLSDLQFFEALLPPFKSYLEEFAEYEQHYHLMRWEDLITHPSETITRVAAALGQTLAPEQASAIWRKLDHVNLTGAHQHNLRRGHGIAEGWKDWVCNAHLDILRDHGLEQVARRYGYGDFPRLDESRYTPFQHRLGELVARGEVFRDYGDEDLFGFAFNKSNIDFSGFGFRQYPWRTHTRIERSSCLNEALVMEVSEVAEQACGQFNAAIEVWSRAARLGQIDVALAERLASVAAPLFDDAPSLDDFRVRMLSACGGAPATLAEPSSPVLLESRGTVNIIHFRGRYYALPQSAGPVDFGQPDLSGLPFLAIADSYPVIVSMLEKT
ncbi:sulfotransferase domain-containing protein [Herbaspirillum seropedicae]|uniref:sulfotransferase domain-containing protein n=1 Tax=Herbaspirillum seropedicae TaxID=964 RepID=UPI0031DB6026